MYNVYNIESTGNAEVIIRTSKTPKPKSKLQSKLKANSSNNYYATHYGVQGEHYTAQ